MKMKSFTQKSEEKENIKTISYRQKGDISPYKPESVISMNSFPECQVFPDYRETEPPIKHGNKYNNSLKTLIPVRCSTGSNPMDDAGFFSFSTFTWLTPMMWNLFKNRLDSDSLKLSPHDGSHINGERFLKLWQEEVARVGIEKASVFAVAMRFQRTRLLMSLIISIFFTFAVFIGPAILVNEIMKFIAQTDAPPLLHGVGLCVALFISEFFKAFFSSLLWAFNLRSAIRMKGAFSMLAFWKISSLRTFSTVTVGELINVMTSDGYRMFEAVVFATFIFCVPILLVVCTIYSCYILGYTALVGVFTYVLFLPVQFYTGVLMRIFRRKAVSVTDKRVRTMNEVLTCIKLIKMYAWEDSFEKKITGIRKKEKNLLEKAGYVQSVNSSLTAIAPALATILTFIIHTAFRFPLGPSTAYTICAIFNSLRMTMGLLPFSVKAVAEAKVAITRLKRLLMIKNPKPYLKQDKELGAALVMNKASFSWGDPNLTIPENPESPVTNGVKASGMETFCQNGNYILSEATLRNITFTLPKGNLLGICGNVGSGKTSLISSLLEQVWEMWAKCGNTPWMGRQSITGLTHTTTPPQLIPTRPI